MKATGMRSTPDAEAVGTKNVIRFDSVMNSASVGGDDRAVPPAPGHLGFAISIEDMP
jgi:hypothetical protein